MLRIPRRYSSAKPLLVLSLLIGLISLPDVTNALLKLIDPTAIAATNFPQVDRAIPREYLAPDDAGVAAPATTFTVTNTNDSGAGSLRQAILDANANAGTDLITFSIGSGLKTISPASSLPTISDPVVIDGTTQPGFAGIPLIEIDALHSNALPNSGVLSITGGGTTIRGLIINGFYNSPNGIVILTAGGNHIEGCYIGTDATGNVEKNSTGVGVSISNSPNNIIGGTTPASRNVISGIRSFAIGIGGSNATGNQIQGNYIGTNAVGTAGLGNFAGIALSSSNNTVGGTVPGARNVISGSDFNGVIISSGTSGNVVSGNYIGTDASGTSKIPNVNAGIAISSSNNTIGGTTAGAGNVVSGNGWGIIIDGNSSNNVVQGNYIGVAADGAKPLGNRVAGISLPNTSNNTVGGVIAGAANTIAFNGPTGEVGVGRGVEVLQQTGHSIRGNSIFSNGSLGIDLGNDGVTPNDVGDGDSGANNRQNFPLITSVTSTSTQTTISGALNSTPNTTFNIDFYSNAACDASGNGEGGSFFDTTTATTDGSGNASINVTFSKALAFGRVITSTATDPSGNTSEFSPCSTNPAAGVVQFAAATISVREDLNTLTIPVNRVGGSSGILTVDFATANNTAIAGQDYTSVSGTLTFADGETTKTISIPITNDLVAESSEELFVTLSNSATPDVVGVNGSVIVKIFDPNILPVLSVVGLSVTEGNVGTKDAIVTVSLNMAIGLTVSVHYQTFEMGATSGVDYQAVSGDLSFAPGVTSRTVTVPIIGDVIDEPDEAFRVQLSNSVNAAISVSSNPPFVLILDDDAAPTIAVNDVGVVEGTSGTTDAVFTLYLSGKSAQQISVHFATADGTATAGTDYQAANGTVVFNAGEISKTVTVLVNGDIIDEPLETFFLNLTTPVNATIGDSQGVATIGTANSAGVKFNAATYNALESDHTIQITVLRSGDTSGPISVDYNTFDGTAAERSDYTPALGSFHFAAGETSKIFNVLLNEDAFLEGSETVNLRLSNPTGGAVFAGASTAVLVIGDTTFSTVNPIEDAQFFVRQHYHDFLNREPDASGLAYWTNQITECQQPGATCDAEVRRINVSAAFFLSIEFQETGYLVERIYKSAYGDADGTSTLGGTAHTIKVPVVRFHEFLADSQQISNGVVVGAPNWQTQLESNKVAFTQDFVTRTRFVTAYALTMTPAEFVEALFLRAGVTPSADERTSIINEFGGAATSAETAARARALRRVAENAALNQLEKNRAFVLMQYFGYLRRDPNAMPDTDHTGYDYWLQKLNDFNGNFVNAEMVKAFISSTEYRQRFGP